MKCLFYIILHRRFSTLPAYPFLNLPNISSLVWNSMCAKSDYVSLCFLCVFSLVIAAPPPEHMSSTLSWYLGLFDLSSCSFFVLYLYVYSDSSHLSAKINLKGLIAIFILLFYFFFPGLLLLYVCTRARACARACVYVYVREREGNLS